MEKNPKTKPENRVVDNKKIAKNSLYLYVRMFITMGVTLYTSRFLLQVLGIDDYGVYATVGGIAVVFSFLNSSLMITSERYIAATIVSRNSKLIKQIFSTCVNSHILLCCIILILSESFGLWLINYKLTIPPERMYAANFVFQFAVISCLIGVFNAPFHACIVAYEKMSFFAIEGICNTVLKLLIIFLVIWIGGDSLIVYSACLMIVCFSQIVMNQVYCRLKLKDIRYSFYWNKSQFKEIFSFAGWNILKNGSFTTYTQGGNIFFNIFGGIVASAAYGVAGQVYASCISFMHGVQSAFNPQIIKSYSAGQICDYFKLVKRAAKFSNYMILFIGVPIILNMSFVLEIWLGNVPDYSTGLSVVMLLSCMLDSFTAPLETAIYAYGRIRNYQIVISTIWLSSTLLLFLALFFGCGLYIALSSRIIAQLAIISYDCLFLHRKIKFPYKKFVRNECLSSVMIFILSLIIPAIVMTTIPLSGFAAAAISSILCWGTLLITIYSFGLSAGEKHFINSKIKRVCL